MIDFEKVKEELIPNMRDGKGTVKARRAIFGDVKIMKLTLEKGASIGLHLHDINCEVYYILSGTAHVELDGKEEIVAAGQAHFCPKGSEHTVCNDGDEPLVMLAVVA